MQKIKEISLEKALKKILDFKKLKLCFECGICTASCPIAELFPEHYNPRVLLHNLPLGEKTSLNHQGYGFVHGAIDVIDDALKTSIFPKFFNQPEH